MKTLVIYHAHSIKYCVLSIATDECGSSVGPGARKPSVGEGMQAVGPHSFFLFFSLLFISAPFSGVCFNNNNMEHGMLFDKLLTRGLPVSIVHFLSSWYYAQQMCVRWKSSVSDSFHVSNGVRQGGVLSPMLLTLGAHARGLL